jgi:site-specific DNA-methyltransferase (adenine-specific)
LSKTATAAGDSQLTLGLERSLPDYERAHCETRVGARVYIGDCRDLVPTIPECAAGAIDLIFADPPFNWARDYDRHGVGDAWEDSMPDDAYCDPADSLLPAGQAHSFTMQWLDACIGALSPTGSMWVNIPDDWAAEIVLHLKRRGLFMVNWCIWHYRFGQNTKGKFISSKAHVLYFCKDPARRVWRADEILEVSDRRSIYFDPRTESKKDGMPAGMRVPMDVWYGQYWGRIQGNNKERRHGHDNQLPEVYLERVIRASSEPGMLVMDPFLGSGTTGVMAHALGRHFIGCEYSPTNARQAWERIEAGPIRLGALEGASTAIFPGRRTRREV